MSQAVDLLEQLQAQFATDRDALTLDLDRLRGEEARLRDDVLGLTQTLSDTLKAARVYAAEMREKAHAAKTSEIAMRARLVCAQDELRATAALLEDCAFSLAIPEKVLGDWGFDYESSGTNPLEKVREIRSWLSDKSKSLRRYGLEKPSGSGKP